MYSIQNWTIDRALTFSSKVDLDRDNEREKSRVQRRLDNATVAAASQVSSKTQFNNNAPQRHTWYHWVFVQTKNTMWTSGNFRAMGKGHVTIIETIICTTRAVVEKSSKTHLVIKNGQHACGPKLLLQLKVDQSLVVVFIIHRKNYHEITYVTSYMCKRGKM